jgi:serine/threonine protein kinase
LECHSKAREKRKEASMAGLEGTILGSCRIIRRIGSGGMGDIYLAEQPELGRQVAVKVISGEDDLLATPETRGKATQRFVREARAIAVLEHPHIIPIYDFGEQNGIRYLVMQYVPVGSLADFVTTPPSPQYKLPLHPVLVADIIDQAAGALQFAHDRQIVHLDVKPQNLLVRILPGSTTTTPASHQYKSDLSYDALANEPTIEMASEIPVQLHILLADFGLARSVGWNSSQSTVAGTPLYTSPEQYSGKASPASDQYALAGVAYLLLTGRPVFSGTLAEVYHHHLAVAAPPATDANPELPPGVNGVLMRALAKDPARRYARIYDFAQALRLSLNAPNQPEQSLWQPTLPVSIINAMAGPSMLSPSPAPAASPLPGQPIPPASPAGSPFPGQPISPAGPAAPGQSISPAGPAISPFPGQPISPAGQGVAPSPDQAIPSTRPVGWPSPPAPAIHPGATPVSPGISQPQFPSGGGQGALVGSSSQPGASSATAPSATTPAGAWPASAALSHPPVPDGAPQKPVRQRSFLNDLSSRQRLLLGGLALIIILGSLSAILLLRVLPHPQTAPTQPTTVQIQARQHKVTGFGLHSLASVPPITSNTSSTQYTLPVRYKWTSDEAAGVASAAASIRQLSSLPPEKGATLSATPGNGALGPAAAHPLNDGLGQQQVGIDSPMDISVASGNDFLFEAVDGTLLISGPSGSRIVSLASFFAPMLYTGNVIGEPRVLYDATRNRWILIANQLNISDGVVTQGLIDVATTSVSGDPAGAWYFYQFNTQIPTYREQCNWADYPQIGINATSIFITATSFACGQNGAFLGADLWELPRHNFQAGSTTPVYSWTGFVNAQGHPVMTLTPAVEGSTDTTEWLVADDAGYTDMGQVSNKLSLWALNDTSSASTGGAASAAPITRGVVTLPFSYADPPAAEQKGSSTRLTTGDARIAQAQLIQGHLFTAFTTAVNWAGSSATRAGVYWLDLVPSLNPSGNTGATSQISANVAQQGIFGLPDEYVFYPSFVGDLQSTIVLFAELSGADRSPGLIFASRSQNSPFNTFGQGNPATLLQVGTAPFQGTHWGDYAEGSLGYSADGKQTFIYMAGVYPGGNTGAWQTSLWKFTLAA